MNIAIVGCGYVADWYQQTLAGYLDLNLSGVYDRVADRTAAFSAMYDVPIYESFDALLGDSQVEIVLNLTNPRSHYEISKACLEAGKHVYSEKPLAMEVAEARDLTELAAHKGLYIASAPCSMLGETAQTVWKALREGVVGRVRAVYAELDGGMVHLGGYRRTVNSSGAFWPVNDEFEVGCTFEHAGYYLAWLNAFFGPVRGVTAFSSCLIEDKLTDTPLQQNAPDFSVGCLEFDNNIVARLTCGIVAPRDHTLRIVGDEGILLVGECWDFGSQVSLGRHSARAARMEKRCLRWLGIRASWPGRKYPLVRKPDFPMPYCQRGKRRVFSNKMDFARGVAEMAAAIAEARPCRLSAHLSLHVTEVTCALQHPERFGRRHAVSSSFEPIAPQPWAL
ncbi:MAG: Gfo/Idh/MocA family protein [Alphaproteobacteria bacterium]